MKKLLHERLRDSKGAIETLDGKVIILFNIEAQALADEIERYYAPLPQDNNGIPCHVGETIYSWAPEYEHSATILEVNGNRVVLRWDDGIISVCNASDIHHRHPKPKDLTHKEPDSLKKLRDDMRSFGEVGADCTSDCCLQYADRLSALIEKVN